jgi:hypothetical protein
MLAQANTLQTFVNYGRTSLGTLDPGQKDEYLESTARKKANVFFFQKSC